MLFKRVNLRKYVGSGQKALDKEENPWLPVLKSIFSPLDITEEVCCWKQRYLQASGKRILKAYHKIQSQISLGL